MLENLILHPLNLAFLKGNLYNSFNFVDLPSINVSPGGGPHYQNALNAHNFR